MANLIQCYQGSKSYGSRLLFQQASFSINEGEHVGVIGPNGAGKTTLFKILVGQEALDRGDLITAKGLRLGYLAQHDDWDASLTVEQYLSQGCLTPIWDLKALGIGLGLSEQIYSSPIASLSGGYRMRCKLLHLLGEEPDLLLLDEPTNYLDLESLLVLERFLQEYRGSFLLISHDREFLRRTTDHILEVEAGDITKYNGSLDDYFEQKTLLRSQLEARALSVEEKRKEVMDFVNRFGAQATKARQAQSRLKSLKRLEQIDIKALPDVPAIQLPSPVHTGKQILKLEGVDLGYGERVVLKNIAFTLARGDHLAVVGINGAGKSTFLKALAGRLAPLRGEIKTGYEVTIGYFAQHVSEALNPSDTVLQAMGRLAHPSITHQQILNLAGSLLFSGDDTKKPVSVLSGGEKSRVALGQILLQKSPCLLLDEPTNHLDFQTVEALTDALGRYEGTVVVVSHDRSFIRRIGTKILEIHNGNVEHYPGSYDEYIWSCQKGMLSAREIAQESARSSKSSGRASDDSGDSSKKFNFKEEKKGFERDLRKAEKEISELDQSIQDFQKQMQELNQKLIEQPAAPEFSKWIKEMGRLQDKLSLSEERWLLLVDERDRLRTQIDGLLNS